MLLKTYTKKHAMRYKISVALREDYIKQDGTCALYLRVYYNKYLRIPLQICVRPDQFDSEKEIVKDNHPRARDFNMMIDDYINRASTIFIEARLAHREVTPISFESEFYNPKARENFIEFFKSELIGRKNRVEKGTYVQHSSTLNKLIRYRAHLPFNNITPEFLESYEEYLKKVLKNENNTIWRDMKNIRTYLRRAEQKDIRFANPFRYYKAPKYNSDPCFLFPDEFAAIVNYYNDNQSHPFSRTLRAFLFSCFTGLRLSDIKTITSKNIVDNEIVLVPAKTKKKNKELRIPLTDQAKQYLIKNSDKLFDMPADQVMNRNLKKIAIQLGIRKSKFSFHAARHTFGFLFTYNQGELLALSKLLGHEKITTTMTYVHLVNDSRTRDNARGIIGKFNK
jgi:integrase/recombinase XerD